MSPIYLARAPDRARPPAAAARSPVAARTGYQKVGLRLAPAAPGGAAYPLMREPACARGHAGAHRRTYGCRRLRPRARARGRRLQRGRSSALLRGRSETRRQGHAGCRRRRRRSPPDRVVCSAVRGGRPLRAQRRSRVHALDQGGERTDGLAHRARPRRSPTAACSSMRCTLPARPRASPTSPPSPAQHLHYAQICDAPAADSRNRRGPHPRGPLRAPPARRGRHRPRRAVRDATRRPAHQRRNPQRQAGGRARRRGMGAPGARGIQANPGTDRAARSWLSAAREHRQDGGSSVRGAARHGEKLRRPASACGWRASGSTGRRASCSPG